MPPDVAERTPEAEQLLTELKEIQARVDARTAEQPGVTSERNRLVAGLVKAKVGPSALCGVLGVSKQRISGIVKSVGAVPVVTDVMAALERLRDLQGQVDVLQAEQLTDGARRAQIVRALLDGGMRAAEVGLAVGLPERRVQKLRQHPVERSDERVSKSVRRLLHT